MNEPCSPPQRRDDVRNAQVIAYMIHMNLKDIVDMMTVERNIELLSERDQDQCRLETNN